MQFINYQYKVLKIEKEDKYGTTAVVEDTININLRKNIRIIELQRDTSEFIEYMKINNSEYRSFRYPYLSEFFYFNKISNIDNKPLGGNKFYITSENFEGQLLFEQVRNKSFDKVLDLAAQLCSTLKYLHLRGYLLCNINVDELSIIEKFGQTMVKVSSLPYLAGIDATIMIDKDNNYFKAPEIFQGNKYSLQSDIYLLGAIIFHMFNNLDIGHQNLRDALADFSPQMDSELYKLKRIISKCIALRPMDRYTSIDQLIVDINESFSKSYPLVETQYIRLIPTRLVKLFARESYMKRVIANAKSYIFDNRNINVTFIQGGIGTGKTSFLTSAFYRLQQEGIDCTLSKLNENTRSSFGVVTYVVKELMKHTERETLDKYSSDLNYLMPELADSANGVISQGELNRESKMRLIYRLGNFLLEVAIRHPFAVAVIDIEWIDEDSFEVFKYIINNTDKGKVLFVFSASLEFESESELLKDSLKKLKRSNSTDKIQFGNYNINETAEFIRLILGIEQAPLDFAANVYKETEGNPNHIYELIYLLYDKKLISVGEDGNWKLKGVDFKKLKISLNINEIVFNKINNLNSIEKEALRIISLFNTAVPSDILEEMTGKKIENLYKILAGLEVINMISKKVDDWGISYDYSSMNVKKTIYEKIPENERLEYHKRASIILEKKFARENRENRDELIYHMTKANNIDAAIKLLMTSADKMLESNLMNQAIQFLEQSFNLFRKNDLSINKIDVCLKLGMLYDQIGEYNKTIYFYDIAEAVSKKIQDKKLLIDVYLNKINIMYKQNNVKSCIKYAINTKKLLKDIDYVAGMYELILSLSDLMINRRRYSLYINILEKVLKQIDFDKDESIYARFLLAYGRHLWAVKKYDEAFSKIRKAESIFERIGQFKYLPQTLNILGACILENNNDLHKAREYFEKTLSISQKVNNLRYIETSYNNLSELLVMEDKYSEAMEYYNNALEVVKITQNTKMNHIVHINKVLVLTLMEEYKNTLEFIGTAEKLFNNYKDSANFLEFFHRGKAEYNYRLGYYELAKAYAQKSVDMCISWGIPHNVESILLKRMAEIHLTENLHYEQDMVLCKSILQDNLYKLGRVACFQLAEIYASKEFYEEARAFMKLGLSYVDKIETDILKV
ncbi:MAG: tetratricopeptide repeat protein, partial [Lutisporaceae bacterium]